MSEESQQPLPYEDGDHCVFYAVQSAAEYFQTPLPSITDRTRYQHERLARVALIRTLGKLDEHTNGSEIWLPLSVQMIISKLQQKNIRPVKWIGIPETQQILEKHNFVKRLNIPFEPASTEGVEDPFPALLFSQSQGNQPERHVWFCPSEEVYEQDYREHDLGMETVLIVPLEQSSSPQKV